MLNNMYLMPRLESIESDLAHKYLNKALSFLDEQKIELINSARKLRDKPALLKALDIDNLDDGDIENVIHIFDALNTNLIYIIDLESGEANGRILNLKTKEEIFLPDIVDSIEKENPDFTSVVDLDDTKSGYIATKHGTLLIVATAIEEQVNQKKDKVLLIGNFITTDKLSRFSDYMGFDMHFWPSETDVIPKNKNDILNMLSSTDTNQYIERFKDKLTLYEGEYDIGDTLFALVGVTVDSKIIPVAKTYFLACIVIIAVIFIAICLKVNFHHRDYQKSVRNLTRFLVENIDDIADFDLTAFKYSADFQYPVDVLKLVAKKSKLSIKKQLDHSRTLAESSLARSIYKDANGVLLPIRHIVDFIQQTIRDLPLVKSERISAELNIEATEERRRQLISELKMTIDELRDFQIMMHNKVRELQSKTTNLTMIIRKQTVKIDL